MFGFPAKFGYARRRMLASKPIAALAPGTVISGKYRVEQAIGAGGMGAVVAARHLDLNTIVAIKVLLPSASNNEEAMTRFVREGRAAAQLTSPHAAKVHDTGRLPSGEPYLVMELLRGRDLRAHLAEVRRVPLGQATDWILQATHALAEAHALRIIHRDVKPANLFLAETADGSHQIKVVDFGISKQLDAKDVELTSTQSTVGTPRYMAPEQMRSSKFADVRGDIWSLGIVLYELTTGRNPFHGDTVTALCFDVMERTPARPSELAPELPSEFDDVVLKCLEKDPDDRYQSMDALSAALRPFARGSLSVARDSLRMGLFYAPAPASARPSQNNTPNASGPVVGVTPLPAVPTPEPTAATKREGPGAQPRPELSQHTPIPHVSQQTPSQQSLAPQSLSRQNSSLLSQIPSQEMLSPQQRMLSQQMPSHASAPQALGHQTMVSPEGQPFAQPAFPETMAFAPLPPELPAQETMRAWDTTAIPRSVFPRERKRRSRLGLVVVGVAVGVGIAAVGMLFAFRERTSTAAMSTSSTTASAPAPSPSASLVQSAGAPADPIVVAAPPTVSASAAAPVDSAPAPSASPSVSASPSSPTTVRVRPLVDCSKPTYTDEATGRKYIKPGCNP